jgi:glutaredoxin
MAIGDTGAAANPGKPMATLLRSLPALASGLLLLGLVLPNPAPSAQPPQAARLALARHLTARGARVYTAYWCPHCQMQKAMFGAEAAALLNVIECAADAPDNRRELCKAKGIQGFPTWEIQGRLQPGVQSLEQLADWSGYRGSRLF